MRSQRSCNARHLTDARAGDIFANSACLAYVYANVISFGKVYTADGEPLEEMQDEETINQDELEDALRSKDPVDWIFMIKSSKGLQTNSTTDNSANSSQIICQEQPILPTAAFNNGQFRQQQSNYLPTAANSANSSQFYQQELILQTAANSTNSSQFCQQQPILLTAAHSPTKPTYQQQNQKKIKTPTNTT
ncbi:unnamed protein product, partial [Iphiclides podalirius]